MTKREIKFRVYGENPYNDDNKKEIYQIDSYYWEEYGSSDIDFSKNCYEDGILMQFTGLKDKNGKEIYEGDIVELWQNNGEQIVINEHKNAVVRFHNCAFFLDEFEQVMVDLELFWLCKYKIIGNIYENPELINHIK